MKNLTARREPPIRREWVQRSYHEYVTKWLLDEWGYARGWAVQLPAMLVWYAKEGSNRPNWRQADRYAEQVRRGLLRGLPRRFRQLAEDARSVTRHICSHRGTNPVEWFTNSFGDLEGGWRALDTLCCGIGPKIASFILRDLSLLRDHSNGAGGSTIVYRNSLDRRWFNALAAELQALLMPIDVYVHRYARRQAASSMCTRHALSEIQSDSTEELAAWVEHALFDDLVCLE